MIQEITTALSATRQLIDIAKSLSKLSKDIKINESAIELQQQIIGLQETILKAQEQFEEQAQKIHELQAQIIAFNNWEKESFHYELVQVSHLCIAYRLKEYKNSNQPIHFLCTNCFEERRKSILQGTGFGIHCPRCKTKFNPR